MKFFVGILIFCTIAALQHVNASDEILNILNTANDLTLQEVNALRPLFNEFQKQYDYITKALENEGENDVVSWQKEIFPQTTKEDHLDILDSMLMLPKEVPTIQYDTKLPTLEELIGNTDIKTADLTTEQLAELEDMQQIIQESLDEAQSNINELVRRAILIESNLLKLNKPKIVEYVYNALSLVFRYSARLRRAAYCVYSHVPDLNESLQNIKAGVDCYKYTAKLILRVQTQTVQTVGTIKRNVFNLAAVYKKIAAKHSILGKILTTVLNLLKIVRNIQESYSVAMKALDDLENQLPGGVIKTIDCGISFAESLPQVLTTVVNVTTCITFVEPPIEYEFLRPESERDFSFDDLN